MPKTYEPIATTTLSSAQATVTFSSIPGTYTDLIIVGSVFADSATNRVLRMRFNSDTGSNYSNTLLAGNGTSAESNRNSNQSVIFVTWFGAMLNSTTIPVQTTIHINNYSNTTTNKTTLIRSDEAQANVTALANLWRNTAAINTISFDVDTGNIGTGTTFTLYGIKAA